MIIICQYQLCNSRYNIATGLWAESQLKVEIIKYVDNCDSVGVN